MNALERFFQEPVFGGDKPDGPAAALVERGTADALASSDWGVNMELCDMINLNVQEHGKDAARALRKRLTNGTPKAQMLALTALEACVKNCGRRFHEIVAQKELLLAVSKLASSKRGDVEVRDKALSLIQDWADAIRLAPYRDTYAELQQRGVDFPRRDVARLAPIHTPPVSVPSADELSPADAAAIALAIQQAEQELATEEQRRVEERTREHVREAMDGGYDFMNARKAEKRLLAHRPAEYMAVPDDNQYRAPAPVYAPEARAAARPAYWDEEPGGGAGVTPGAGYQPPAGLPGYTPATPAGRSPASPPHAAAPTSPAALRSDLAVVRSTVEVLSDMLRCCDASRPAEVLEEPIIAEVAGQCRSALAPRVHSIIQSCADEALLCEALALNDEIQRVLEVHDYLTAAARAAAGPQAGGGAGGASPPALPPKPARLASGGAWGPDSMGGPASSVGGAEGGAAGAEDARLAMRARARSRGAALLAEAGGGLSRLPPPPPSRQRTSAGDAAIASPPPSSAAPPPPSSAAAGGSSDLLFGLDALAPPSASLAAASVAMPSPMLPPRPAAAAAAAAADPFESILSASPAVPPSATALPSGFAAGSAFTNPSFDLYAPPPPSPSVTVPPAAALAEDLDRRLGLAASPRAAQRDVFASLPPVVGVGSPGGAAAPPPPPPSTAQWAAAGPSSMRPPPGAGAASPPPPPPPSAQQAADAQFAALVAAASPPQPPASSANPFL